jgi:predicted site-specific integrase-resolvase
MNVERFAKRKGISYRTALNWLKEGLVPGAVEKTGACRRYWYIPLAALAMEKPKRGAKKGVARITIKPNKETKPKAEGRAAKKHATNQEKQEQSAE